MPVYLIDRGGFNIGSLTVVDGRPSASGAAGLLVHQVVNAREPHTVQGPNKSQE